MDLRLCLFLLATTVAKPQENISPECSLETDGFCDDGQEQTVESVELDQTIPKILLVGPTGSGKSSMANSLLGLDPENEDAMFPVCMDMDSCTKETTYAEGKWLGYGERFIVVDTPGLQDSDGQDNQLIREMVDVLKNKVKTVDCIVLLIEGKTERFHAGLTTQLRQLSTMFGERWWDFLLIGVSKWEYDEKTIIKRERKCVPGKKSCKDEKWFKRNILHQLENKFHQKRSFDFAFIHSYSQIEDNKDDESEQKHWKEETDKLWSFVKSKNSSSFELKGVDDILEDNRRLKRQVNELENTIDTDITYLKGEIQMIKETHDSELNQLKNKTLVNKEELTQTMKTNNQELTQTMKTNNQELTQTMKTYNQELTQAMENELTQKIETLDLLPMGSIIAWTPIPNLDSKKPVDIPDGWVECDGGQIAEGEWRGEKTPNINGHNRFLRGSGKGQVLQTENQQVKELSVQVYVYEGRGGCSAPWSQFDEHQVTTDGNSYDDKVCTKTSQITGTTSGGETRPINIRVVYIMKIK